ncbi:alpha/beta hydrolase [Methylobacterium sp. Leaf99]|uniref:alpha/beta hydrolase n=1 Tax=Methylobacterium sp. Leaf99 TaxID=1736251 RepID=UPI0006F4287B|nr:alpha/beta hydrolase [Methylobacterium sp. Leaf99]KQP10507.1 alpha/beta hydrolase [Methylobacterium sp. Leaf99]
MRLLLFAVLGLPAALLGALVAFQRHLIYPGAYFSRHAEGEARPAPGGTAAVTLTTPDGERLLGYWRPPAPGGGVVLSFHGNASAPESAAVRFTGGPWGPAGWGVLAIAYRGYPGSTGHPSEDGLIRDGLAAHDAAAAWAPGAPILLHGHSLGAAVAVAVAARRPHLGLYLEAPFDSLRRLVGLRYPLVPRLFLRDTYRSDRRIAGTTGPVFVVHGLQDGVIPVTLARRLAALAGPRARLEAIAGDHVSILGARDGAAQTAFRDALVQRAAVDRPAAALAAP